MDEDAAKAQAGCGCIGLIVALILAAVLGGYWRTDVTYTAPAAENAVNPVQFEEDLTARHFLGGLVKGEQPDLDAAVAKHVGKGKRLKNLTITTRHSIKDIGLTIVTLTIYAPVTVTVKGTVEDVIAAVPAAPAATTTQ